METLFSTRQWIGSPLSYWTIQYEHRRNGADMQYRFYYKVWLNSSGGWYYNALKMPLYLNGSNIATIQVKTYNNNESGWTYSGTTGWYTVSGKTSGTTPFYAVLVDTGGYAQANWNVRDTSPTYNLTVDPAESKIGDVANFTVGNAISIPITKYSSNFTDTLVISYDGTAIKTISGITNGASVSFTSTELNTIYSLMSTVNSGTFSFVLTTTNGSTTIGTSSDTATGTITGANPTFTASNITYKDTNSSTTSVTGNNQHLVQNLSNLLVTLSAATGNKGATITSYEATINGVKKTLSSAGNIDYGVINSSQNLTLTVKVTDSRGNTTSASKTVTFLAWSLPTAIISLKRKNNYEDETYLKVDASYSSVNSKNTINIQYQYKKATDTSYSQLASLNDNEQVTLINDKNSAWNYKIILTDAFGTTTYNATSPRGKFIFFVDTKKLSVGVNCFPSTTESLEVNGKPILTLDKVYPIGSIYMTVDNINPKDIFGGTWEQLKDRFLLGAGNTYGLGGTGGSSTVTLSTTQIPGHTHSFSATSGATTASHTHSFSATSGGVSTGHKHDWSGTTSSSGSHVHTLKGYGATLGSGSAGWRFGSGGGSNASGIVNSAGGHTHTVSGTTGYQSNSHTHSVSGTTGSGGASHSHSVSGTTGSTGGNGAHDNMPPYLVVNIWKRTG